jgi:transmembrane sensor
MARNDTSPTPSVDDRRRARQEKIASDQAIEWIARLRAHDVTPEEQGDFAEWLSADPLHGPAFDEATLLWEALAELPEQTDQTYAASKRSWRRWSYPLAAAATIVLSLAFVFTQSRYEEFSTGKGEQRRVVLADGSAAHLNTDSAMTVWFTADERAIRLDSGEVWFDVVHDPERPFRVSGTFARAEAVGTAFAVRDTPGFTRISVTEGLVSVSKTDNYSANVESILVSARHEGTFSPQSSETHAFDADAALAWRRGQLVYDDVLLGDVIADLNRYLPKTMTINDEELARTRISGVLFLEDQEAMLTALASVRDIKWKAVSDTLIIITKA